MTGAELTLLASALPSAGTVAAAGAGLSAVSAIAGGRAASAAAKTQAKQLEQQAGQDLAMSQRAAEQSRREADIVNSNLKASVGAGGGNLTDPTISKLSGDIVGQGEENALAALYSGQERYQSGKTQASAARLAGKQAKNAGIINAAAGGVQFAGSPAGKKIGTAVTNYLKR